VWSEDHCEKSWIAGNGIFWLRDLLPTTLPAARIFSYRYDIDPYTSDPISKHALHDHALALVKALMKGRGKTGVRILHGDPKLSVI